MSTDARPRRAPTLEQVAARAGVGRGTASRVINGSEHVSEASRAAVLRAIEDLGYVPNRAARSLVTRLTDVIALVVSESEERFFGEPFFGQIVRGVSGALAGSQRQLLLTMSHRAHDRGRLDNYLSRQHVDGVLLLSLHGDDPLPGQLEARGVPAVLGGRPSQESPLHFVDVDNIGGSGLAIAHLARIGRRRIATIAGPQDMSAGQHRLDGYRSALAAAGLAYDPDLVVIGDFSERSGWEACVELTRRRPDLDAVFAASDQMAVGAIEALTAQGRRVPEDIAVVGFDDSPSSRYVTPRLTTVHQPVEEMGAAMVHLLSELIADTGDPIEDIVLNTHLVVRDSG
jgi:DNA-binding LacI/PurR family transcriptional regulator